MIKEFERVYMRLYFDNENHQRILEVLNNLDKDLYKTKNKFIEEAILFYIDNYGKEEFMEYVPDSRYISREEFNKCIKELKEEIKLVSHDQSFKILGQLMSGMANNNGSIKLDETSGDKYTDSAFEEESEITDYAMSFMDFN